jgi:sulfate transport system ATP-binding protein
VLFRPEDVDLALTSRQLESSCLGLGEVEQVTFGGSFERLHLRLPPLPGVRAIAPPVPFGEDTIVVEATRSQDQAIRMPLQPGQDVWVGVQRVHALEHPGLRFLVLTDGSPLAQAAVQTVGHMARLAHARVTLLGYGLQAEVLHEQLQEAKESLGGGLAALEVRPTSSAPAAAVSQEVERQPYDLVVMGFAPTREHLALAESILEAGEHHLLLVPAAQPAPTQVLICVTAGELGKEDVRFSGRLTRHLGASALLLSVVATKEADTEGHVRAQRFLASGERTLEMFGVPAETAVRYGSAAVEILSELESGAYDLLVMGAPLPDGEGQISLAGVIEQVLAEGKERLTLIVRTSFPRRIGSSDGVYQPGSMRIHTLKEIA